MQALVEVVTKINYCYHANFFNGRRTLYIRLYQKSGGINFNELWVTDSTYIK